MKIKILYKFLLLLTLVTGISIRGNCQKNDSLKIVKDTFARNKSKQVIAGTDSIKRSRSKDSGSLTRIKTVQLPDTILKDSTLGPQDSIADSVLKLAPGFLNPKNFTNNQSAGNLLKRLLDKNKYINVSSAPVFRIDETRNNHGKEFIFYSLFTIVLILGVFKTFYSGYFNNLFRVFFNTSLRQTQLTDQLLQAKLPSLILNLFFMITAGVYVWLLFSHFNPPRNVSPQMLLPFCILAIVIIYAVKYSLLKFTGYITGIQNITDNYIFIIFLINKITGILLLPFVILLAFSPAVYVPTIATISGLLLALFFVSRYVKSYGFIDGKMPFNPFHFIIYIVGAEIIPLLVLYKIAKDYML